MMERTFKLPDLGEGLHEAEIVEWYVAEGDQVEADQPLVSVETDKAVVEVPSPDAGARAPIVKAAPVIRAMANRLGVDLQTVEPSRPGGAITHADVEKAVSDDLGAGPMQPLRGVRRAMAVRMAATHSEIVPAAVSDDVDVEAWIDKGDVTVRIIHAIVAACSQEPASNAWCMPNKVHGDCMKPFISASPSTPNMACSCQYCATSDGAAMRICGKVWSE